MSFLESVQQLRPLLRKFGAQAIYDRLSIEVDGPGKQNRKDLQDQPTDAVIPIPEKKRKCRADFGELVREFSLVPESSHPALENHELPKITLVEGFLLINGSVVPHSEVNHDDLTVRWSRKVGSQSEYEHGWLQFDGTGVSAVGSVLFCEGFEPATLAPEDLIFVETSSVQEQNGSEQARSKRSSPSKVAVEPAGKPVADPSVVPVADPSVEPVAVTSMAEHGRFTEQYNYRMTFDRRVWPEGTDRSSAIEPFDGGIIVDALFITNERAELPLLRVPILDRLCDHINTRYRRNEPKLEPFYTSSASLSIDDKWRYFIEVNMAALIPFISSSEVNVNLFNVSFSDIGFHETLPFLFQSLYVEFSASFVSMTGAMYAYDPNMRGMKGNRYDHHSLIAQPADFKDTSSPAETWAQLVARNFAPKYLARWGLSPSQDFLAGQIPASPPQASLGGSLI